ncbi:hypothetical protein CXB51_034818 [Gossypium anomalum]|uniref:Shikimate dehydrogenase substrate binding N-terminal domain-containing protein n=1 Tax=Gossypium anomalum TaxID=47600 RepID=A0A8J5XX18_9ROSI|nr:hypothetical protein CXB51_034818 [Gossypium anomalum]
MGSTGILKNSTMICAPLMGETVEQMVKEMKQAKAESSDLLEIRLDHITNFHPHHHLPAILDSKPLPLIILYRPKWDGGLYEGDEHSRLQALRLAAELGADYIDFELKVASHLIRELKINYQSATKFIVSCHITGTTPSDEELANLAATMRATGADILKVVVNVMDITEIARIFHLLSHYQMPVIAYSVGERGLISQLLCPKFGGFLAYRSIEGYSIPGMRSLYSVKHTYKHHLMNSETKVFGLVSKPVSHENFNGVYVPLFVDNLKEFFSTYSGSDFPGFSVGIPYKEAVVEFCDEVHPLAESIGAVNTIIRRPCDGKLIGYNTDCEAAITSIEDALKGTLISGKLFVLVGAGGAGRALAFGAKSRGARILIFDIDFERAKSLASAVLGEAQTFEQVINFRPEKGAILANATPLGMHPYTDQRIPVDQETLGDYELAAGAITVSGVEMFLRQAVSQFNLFTDRQAPEEFMREIITSEFWCSGLH